MGMFDALKKTQSTWKDTGVRDYISLAENEQIKVQVASPVEFVYKHWIQTDGKFMPINCLGLDECPICEHNRGLEDGYENPNFIKTQQRFLQNVVDLTSVKICSKCEYVNARNASKCGNEECSHILIDEEARPLNRVRYLEGSRRMFNKIASLAGSNLDGDSDEIKLLPDGVEIQDVPIAIRRVGSRQDTDYIIVPMVTDPEAVDVSEYKGQLFDLKNTGIKMNYNELMTLMNGGSFKAIMESRRNSKSEVAEELNELFKD